MTEQLENVREMYKQSDKSRAVIDQKLGSLAEALSQLIVHVEANTPSADALNRVAEGQEKLLSILGKMELSEAQDAESRMRLRSIDVQLLRLLEEISTGRQETATSLSKQLEELTLAVQKRSRK